MRALLSKGRAIPPNGASPMVLPQPPVLPPADVEGLDVEHLSIETEVGERCPFLMVRETSRKGEPLRPVIIMHGTNGSKTQLLDNGFLQRVARMGLLAVGVDTRHVSAGPPRSVPQPSSGAAGVPQPSPAATGAPASMPCPVV